MFRTMIGFSFYFFSIAHAGNLYLLNDKEGDTLLTNVVPKISSSAKNKNKKDITVSDLVASGEGLEDYRYVEPNKNVNKKVFVGSKPIYRNRTCQMGDAYFRCSVRVGSTKAHYELPPQHPSTQQIVANIEKKEKLAEDTVKPLSTSEVQHTPPQN